MLRNEKLAHKKSSSTSVFGSPKIAVELYKTQEAEKKLRKDAADVAHRIEVQRQEQEAIARRQANDKSEYKVRGAARALRLIQTSRSTSPSLT